MDDFEAFTETIKMEDHEAALSALKNVRKWRAAKSTIALRRQLEIKFPNRNKYRDGIIGGLDFCPGLSDHCPNVIDGATGVVTAIDITHDPRNGCDIERIAHSISMSMDARIKYIIHGGQICRSYVFGDHPAWSWQIYTGRNKHLFHGHFSIGHMKRDYDSTVEWEIGS